MKSQELGQKIATKYSEFNGNAQAVIDPTTIFTFAQIIMDVIQQLQACKQSKSQAYQNIKSPGLFHRIQLRRHLKDVMGNKEFRNNGENMVQSILEVGKTLTQEDVSALYDE